MNYEQYHQKGGFYVIPVEIFDDLCEEKDELQKENQKLKYELEQCIAVADTNKELAESFHKENERLKSLLKCDYEDSQSIMAELTTENKQLKENNLAMQEEMTRTWAKLQQKEDIINKAKEYNNQIIKDTKEFYRPTSDLIYSGDCLIDLAEQNIKILDNKGE